MKAVADANPRAPVKTVSTFFETRSENLIDRSPFDGRSKYQGTRPRCRRIDGSVVEEKAERFRKASELNPFEPNSMTRQPVKDRFYGATRRDRTGDLLITKFRVWRDVVDSVFGAATASWADWA